MTMDAPTILERLEREFPDQVVASDMDAIDPSITVAAASLPAVCRFLRDQAELRFNVLHCVSVVDYFEPDPKKAAKVTWQPHLELLYHLSSIVHRHRIVLKVVLPRWKDDRPGELPEVPSVVDVWPAADWHEREVYDLGGVRFTGHPDLRRILCPEDWEGHPLRKDYQQPQEYHGVRGR